MISEEIVEEHKCKGKRLADAYVTNKVTEVNIFPVASDLMNMYLLLKRQLKNAQLIWTTLSELPRKLSMISFCLKWNDKWALR